MNIKQTTLAAAVAATLALGVSGQAAASVYAASYLDISNLHVLIDPLTGASIDSFTFSNNISAGLNNGPADAEIITCSGSPGTPGATTNNCSDGGDYRLNAEAVNADGSTVQRTDNDFIKYGPGSDQYSNADAVIWTAALTGDVDGSGIPTTSTTQVAEAEIQGGISAASASTIDSITGFTFSFSTVEAGNMLITFDALQYLEAAIDDPTGINQNSLATMNVEIKLSRDGSSTDFWLWSSSGESALGCIGVSLPLTMTCTELADPFALNTQAQTSTDGTTDLIQNTGSFGVLFGLLGAGDYTLTLTQKVSTLISRQQVVPEPGILALMGIGLLGLGMSARRKKLA